MPDQERGTWDVIRAHRKKGEIRHGREGVRESKMQKLREEEHAEKNKRRYDYANIFVTMAKYSLVFVAVMLFLTGCEEVKFELTSSVLVAMLGTALANVLAPVYLLVRYLFNTNANNN